MERTSSGSPRSVIIPDIPDEDLNFPAHEEYPFLDRSQDDSFLSMETPPRNDVYEQAADSDVSLSAKDVKFFVKALKRLAGDDFSDLIQTIKKKQEPNFQRLARKQTLEKPRVYAETVNEFVEGNFLEDEGEGLDLRIEVATACPTMAVAPDKIVSKDILEDLKDETKLMDADMRDRPLPKAENLKKKGRVNSILESDNSSASTSFDSEDTPLTKPVILKRMSRTSSILDTERILRRPDADKYPGHAAVEVSRRISFSTADRVRLYDLTEDEVVHKRLDEEDNIILEARRRRQGRKMPGVFCASGPQVNEASQLLAKLYAGGVERAKVSCWYFAWLSLAFFLTHRFFLLRREFIKNARKRGGLEMLMGY